MKKRGLCYILTSLLVVSLTACGKQDVAEKEIIKEPVQMEQTEKEEKESVADKEEQTTDNASSEPEQIWEETGLYNIYKASHSLTYSDYERNNLNCIRVEWDSFSLSEEDAIRYPGLDASLRDFCETQDASMQEYMNSLKDAYVEMVEYQDDTEVLEDCTSYSLLRTDTKVLSFLGSSYSYTGGAHGYYASWGKAYDVATGKALSVGDIITDEEQFRTVVANYLDQEYGDIFFYDIYATIKDYDMDQFCWSLSYSGITLFFNPYELASYADGMQIFEMPFAEYGYLFDEQYFVMPSQYVVSMQTDDKYTRDVNSDGRMETFSFGREYTSDEEYDYYDNMISIISWNGERRKCNIAGFSAEAYYVQTKTNGYMYIFHKVENDYTILEIIDLSTGENVGEEQDYSNLYLPGQYEYNENTETNVVSTKETKLAFVNPEKVLLGSRLDLLSTYGATRWYHIGEDGIPVAEGEWYEVNAKFLIRTKADLPCRLVDGDGVVTSENGILPAGVYCKILRVSDKEVDLIVAKSYQPTEENWYYAEYSGVTYDEKTIYRITLDSESNYTIGGEDVNALFDGLLYAG